MRDQAGKCSECQDQIGDSYFMADTQMVCPLCRDRISARPVGFSAPLFFRALVLGAATSAAGAIIWYGVAALTGLQFSFLAIGVGAAVGFAVRTGTGGRAGVCYGALAVVLTYLAIVGAAVPGVLALANGRTIHVWSLAVAIVVSPFLSLEQVKGLVIIGIGLWTAWKFGRVIAPELLGPYHRKS